MQCKKCGSEDFELMKIQRNKRWNLEENKWVVDMNCDTRIWVCESCDTKIYTSTTIDYIRVYNEVTLKTEWFKPDQFKAQTRRELVNQKRLFEN